MSALSTTEAAQRIAKAERERAEQVKQVVEPVSVTTDEVTVNLEQVEQVGQVIEQVEAQAKQAEDEAKQAAAAAKKKAADDKKVKTALKRAKLSENSELTDDQRNRALDPGNRKGDTLAKFILHGGNGGSNGDAPVAAANTTAEVKAPREPGSVPMYEQEARQIGKPCYAGYLVLENGDLRPIGVYAGQERPAAAMRAAIANLPGMTAEKAATCNIVSARPNNLRCTPPLSQ